MYLSLFITNLLGIPAVVWELIFILFFVSKISLEFPLESPKFTAKFPTTGPEALFGINLTISFESLSIGAYRPILLSPYIVSGAQSPFEDFVLKSRFAELIYFPVFKYTPTSSSPYVFILFLLTIVISLGFNVSSS